MSDTSELRNRPGLQNVTCPGRDPRRGWRASVAAVAGAFGLALAVACVDVEPKHARTRPATEASSSARPEATVSGVRQASAPSSGLQSDLGVPTHRTVVATHQTVVPTERSAQLELDLPSRRVVRPGEGTVTQPKPPPEPAAPRAVDRVRVTVHDQRLQLLAGREVLREYPVSTAKNGIGSQTGSQRTPLGLHRVHSKFGAGEPLGMVFEARRASGKVAAIHTTPIDLPEDVITTRILWLEGLEPGKNRGKGVDSHTRFIYIHGTNEEGLIGQPASHGCVRMRNRDVVELFELVAPGTLVEILE